MRIRRLPWLISAPGPRHSPSSHRLSQVGKCTIPRKPNRRSSRSWPTPRSMAGAGEAHRHPCGLGVPRGRSHLQGQAGGALSVPRLFDAGSTQVGVRRGARRQSRFAPDIYRAGGTDHARGGRTASRSAATASRSSGRLRCAGSTRTPRSIGWPIRDASMTALADRLGRDGGGGARSSAGGGRPAMARGGRELPRPERGGVPGIARSVSARRGGRRSITRAVPPCAHPPVARATR